MDRIEAIEKVKQYAQLITLSYSPEKIVLFGSYANNCFNENSDIDVAIIVNKITGDFISTAASLCKLTRNIDYRIEPVLVELENDKSGFVKDVLKTGIIVYDKSSC